MLYAERDPAGQIVRLSLEASPTAEPVPLTDPAVTEFLRHAGDTALATTLLEATDPGIARVAEDLIELLVAKRVLLITELPEAAQAKLLERRRIRDTLGGANPILGDDDIV